MKTYEVSLTIELDAEDPEEAVENFIQMSRQKDMSWIYDVENTLTQIRYAIRNGPEGIECVPWYGKYGGNDSRHT